jgi:hypothetical protein
MSRYLDVSFMAAQLKVVLTGEHAPIVGNGTEEAVASWRAILEEVRRCGAPKILIIDRMNGPASSPRAVTVGKAASRRAHWRACVAHWSWKTTS